MNFGTILTSWLLPLCVWLLAENGGESVVESSPSYGDHSNHLFSHLTHRDFAQATMRAIWPTMRLGILTTAIGFSSLLLDAMAHLSKAKVLVPVAVVLATIVLIWSDTPLWEHDGHGQSGA